MDKEKTEKARIFLDMLAGSVVVKMHRFYRDGRETEYILVGCGANPPSIICCGAGIIGYVNCG